MNTLTRHIQYLRTDIGRKIVEREAATAPSTLSERDSLLMLYGEVTTLEQRINHIQEQNNKYE